MSAAATERAKARAARAELSRKAWAARHPEKARAERAIRKRLVILDDRWGHKANGTPATHEAAEIAARDGAMARLYASGAIDEEQLDASEQIRAVHERIAADVVVKTASLETRVDTFRHGDGFFEALGAVRREVAYGQWRAYLGNDAALVLAVIVEDLGITLAARRHRMHVRRARRILFHALDCWWIYSAHARRDISEADLAAAQAGIL